MTLLRKIERFLQETGMARTRFGRLAVNDPRLVDDLRRGREPGQSMIARAEALIESYRA